MSTDLISTIFADLPGLRDKIQKQLGTTKKQLTDVFPVVLKSGGLTLPETQRLICVQELCELASGDDAFCNVLLDTCSKQLSSPDNGNKKYKILVHVALNLYHDDNVATSRPETAESFRVALWRHVPLAILLSTLRAGKLLTTHSRKSRAAVKTALEAAVRKRLTLVSAEFRALIHEPNFFQEKVEEDDESDNEEDSDEDSDDESDEEDNDEQEELDAGALYDLLLALYRLHFLVSAPSHIDVLLRLNLRSAHDVAVLSRGTFLSIVEGENKRANALLKAEPGTTVVLVDKAAATRLHDHATAIDCRNQETWVRILDSLKQDFRGIDGQEPTLKPDDKITKTSTSDASIETLLAHQHYNMTEIFDLQSSPCEDCCSVISPSAYLVDLLNFLKACVFDSPPGPASTVDPVKALPAPSTLPITPAESKNPPTNLLELLALRRPDLTQIELSCANSTVMLPYIAIVNEVLESFIASEGGNDETPAVSAVNCPQDSSSPHSPAFKSSMATVSTVFTKKIASAMFPLDVFPYSRSKHAIKAFLGALGLSYGDILSAFRSEAQIISAIQGSKASECSNDTVTSRALSAQAAAVWNRAAAAEILGLQALDVAAIARDTIYTPEFIHLAVGLRDKTTGISSKSLLDGLKVPEVWKNWGFDSLDSMLDESEDNASGLCFVRGQFLPRSGLSFAELLELLDSLFFGRRLVLTNAKRSKTFTGQISEMRLQALDLAAQNPNEKAVGPLTAQLCHELQAFVRLRARLGWSVHELDTALSAILENHTAIGISTSASEGISMRVLTDLAYIITLSELVGIPVQSLLPLWTEGISTHGGSQSLYARTFQDPGLVLAGDDVFVPTQIEGSSQGLRYFDRVAPLSDHKPALMTTLNRSAHEIQCLLQASEVQSEGQQLSMSLLGKLFRHSTMSTILQASPAEYLQVLSFLPNHTNLFQDPQTTLDFVKAWRKLLDSGWSTTEILASLTTIDATNSAATSEALVLTSGLIEKLEGLLELWVPRLEKKTIRDQDVAAICVQLFDGPTAQVVSAFIEGTQISPITAKLDSPEGKAILGLKDLPPNLKVVVAPSDLNGTVTLTLTGVFSEKTKNLVLDKSDIPRLHKLVEELETKSLSGYKALASRLFDCLPAKVKSTTEALFQLDIRHGTKGEDEADDLIAIDKARHDRRDAFVRAALPALRAQCTQDVIVRAIETAVGGGIEAPVLSMLATSPFLTTQPGSERESALDALGKLFPLVASREKSGEKTPTPESIEVSDSEDDSDSEDGEDDEEPASQRSRLGRNTVGEAFFCPAATDSYRFLLLQPITKRTDGSKEKTGKETEPVSPTLSINGIAVPVARKANDAVWESASIMMTTGQTYLLASSVPLNGTGVSWRTEQSIPTPFTSKNFVPRNTVSAVAGVLAKAVRVARLVKKLGLGLEELQYVVTSPSPLIQLDLHQPSISSLCTLETYRTLRESADADGGRGVVIDLLAWLSNPKDEQTTTALSSRIAKAIGFDEQQIKTAIELKYTNSSFTDIVACFRNIDNLVSLKSVLDLSQRIALTPSQRREGSNVPQPLELLFQIAIPPVPGQSNSSKDKDAEAAAGLQACLGEGPAVTQCINDMREAQRTALVSYLLQQKYVRRLGIADADGLFGHFLLDVQMGAQLEITRIKAAISTVQLFVQRCLLGVEPGASTARIDRDKWAWMSRHNLWQATRKAFLYPENWIEPSLRDDKTPQFDTLEQALLSKDLSWKSFTKSMRDYVQSLQGISDLDIVAYLREDVPRNAPVETYHFFGRTRSAPYTFYHRIVRITAGEKVRAWWTPWTKIDVDAMTYEADWDGKSLANGSGSYMVPVMRNNRLFLYLPQIMTRPVSASSGGDGNEPKSFKAMAETKPPSGAGPCNWEIRMAWTELVDGSWTPKRVSQGQLVVHWDGPTTGLAADAKVSTELAAKLAAEAADQKLGWKGLPSIANFIFASETAKSDVAIRVAFHRPVSATSNGLRVVGKFVMSEERIVSVQDAAPKHDNKGVTMRTNFHKFQWKALKDPVAPKDDKIPVPQANTYSYALGKSDSPLLAIPKREYDRTLTWTMSFSSATQGLSHAAGLVVDEQASGDDSADGRSIFMCPPRTESTLESSNFWKGARSETIEHSAARKLMEAVCQKDESKSLEMLFEELDASVVGNADWGKDIVASTVSNYHELATSYALYNWELGMHAILLAVDRFHATQQFELALRAARLVFDPTIKPPPEAKTAAERAAACWRFRPFRDMATNKSQMADKFTGWPTDYDLGTAVTERRNSPSTVHATARGRPQAYMKWIVMKYVEILIAAGDVFFRQGSMETLPLAIQRYVEAAHVLGPDPPAVPRLAKASVRNYNNIGDVGATMDLELNFPFLCAVERRGTQKEEPDHQDAVLCFLKTTYFGLPPNPKYASMRTLVADRLFKARNNLDINGRPIVYAMAEPAIDPALLLGKSAAGGAFSSGGIASLMNDFDCPMPYQRFSVLLSKALELCAEVRSMAEQFLSAREKRDVEAFSLLKATQDATLKKLASEIKLLQKDEITKTIESLNMNRDAAVAHLKYLLRLTGDPLDRVPDTETKGWQDIDQHIHTPTSDDLRMSPFEQGEMIAAGVATGLKAVAMGMETVVGVLRAIPEVTTNAQPMGCGVTVKADATNAARITKGIMGSLKVSSAISADVGTALGRAGALTRQLQERRMQANAKGREIKNIDKQIEIQRARLALHARELEMQKTEVAHTAETETWLRSKYTNEHLYTWLEGQLRTIHYDMYSLAADMCRRAERAFRFERGARTPVSFLRPGGYWDSSRDGLLAAQQLSLDLRRMEAAFLGAPAHDVELTKNISLRQLDPQALMAFREKGVVSFSLPEVLFDLDFPGHYMRRIQAVAVSIPCIVGPHATVAATVSLTQHSYRISAAASSKDDYLAGSVSNGSFRTDNVPIAAVATSSGIQDTGSFELSFGAASSSGSYGPFEGAGAVSSWRLELPPSEFRSFDYTTISDVVLHMRYTAVDGGPMLKRAATNAVTALRQKAEGLGARDGFWGFLEARHDLSSEWHAFRSILSQKGVKRTASLDLSRLASRLPFWAKRENVRIESLTVAVNTSDAAIATSLGIEALKTTKDKDGKVQQKWSPSTLGSLKLLTRDNLSKGNVSLSDAGWTLTVEKNAGQSCDITDLTIFFRYVLVEPPKPRRT